MEHFTNVLVLLSRLCWKEVIIVANSDDDVIPLTQTLGDEDVQHVLVTGSEVLSGEWVRDVVKTGVDSWRPVHLLLMCSVTCINAALRVASQLEQQHGTQSAFGMASRWLLMPKGNGHLSDQVQVTNVTLDNVAVLRLAPQTHPPLKTDQTFDTSNAELLIHTLQRTSDGRVWTFVTKLENIKRRKTVCKMHHRGVGTLGANNMVSTAAASAICLDLEAMIFPNTLFGYNQRRIRVLVKNLRPYVFVGRDHEWSGLLMDYLHLASSELNFTYELVDAKDDEWGSGTLDDPDRGFLGYVVRREVDIGLANFAMTWERSQLLESVCPFLLSPYVMAYRKPEVKEDFRMPLGPLSTSLETGVAVALVLVSLLLSFLELAVTFSIFHVHKRRAWLQRWTLSSVLCALEKSFYLTGSAIVKQSSERKPKSRGGRVLLWSWWMLSLVVTAAYSGTLTAFLSVSSQPQLFSRPEDLLTKSHSYTWGYVEDSVIPLILKNSSDPVYQGLWSGIQRFRSTDPTIVSAGFTAAAHKVVTEDHVLFLSRLSVVSMFGTRCDVVIQDAGMRYSFLGPSLPKDSALLKPLSDLALRLQSNGVLSQWTEKWFYRTDCPVPTGPVVISLLHMRGVLLVLPGALGLGLIVLAAEVLYRREHEPKQQ